MERGSVSPRQLRADPLSSQVSLPQQRGTLLSFVPCLSRGTYTNLELFRGSESPTSPSHRPRPAPGRRIARYLGAAGHQRSLSESVGASGAPRQPRLRAARPGLHARGQGTRRPRSRRPARRQLMPKGPSGEEVPGGGPAPHGRVWGEKKNQGAKRKRRWGEPQLHEAAAAASALTPAAPP